MKVRAIHKAIWQYITDNLHTGKPINVLKNMAVSQLPLTEDAKDLLGMNNYCVLCTIYHRCRECPLKTCMVGNGHTLYKQVVWYNDKEAASKIRDVRISRIHADKAAIRTLERE